MNALPWTIYISFAGAAVALVAGARSAVAARWIGLLTAAAAWVLTLVAAVGFDPHAGMITLTDVSWIPHIGARYHLAADGISLVLLVLTGLAATAGVLFSWNIDKRAGEFFALYLTLIGGVYGVFLSADAFLFFVFYEIAIVPKYLLIGVWGSTRKEYGAMKLVLYSFGGSALVMAGLIWLFAVGGGEGFGLSELAAIEPERGQSIAMFALVFTGFAVLAGLFPFHTWAPTGHVAAPTGASMLLAGVVMKLGAYGCLRVAMPLFPEGFVFWQTTIAALALIGIVYAGLIALVHDDFKFVIGYSSVSHMGFVLLGLAAANAQALSGAVLQMFSHGVIAGLLFAVVGRMVYDRTHTRRLDDLRGMALHRSLPFAAVAFVIAGLASMGMPGFSGFPAELTILVGAWKVSPSWTVIAAGGVVIAGAFTLRAIHLSFFGNAGGSSAAKAAHVVAGESRLKPLLPPTTWPERVGAALLIGAILLLGLQPGLFLDWILPALEGPLFQPLLTAGGVP